MKSSELFEADAKKAESVHLVWSGVVVAICGGFGYMWANDLWIYAGSEMEWWWAGVIPVVLSSPFMMIAKFYENRQKHLSSIALDLHDEELLVEIEELEKEKAYLERQQLRDEELKHERALRDIRTGRN